MFLEKEACDASQTVKYSTSVTNSTFMIIFEKITLSLSYFHEQSGKHPVLGLPSTWTLGIQPNPPANILIPEKLIWSGVGYYTVYKSNHCHHLPLIRPQLFFYIYSTYISKSVFPRRSCWKGIVFFEWLWHVMSLRLVCKKGSSSSGGSSCLLLG